MKQLERELKDAALGRGSGSGSGSVDHDRLSHRSSISLKHSAHSEAGSVEASSSTLPPPPTPPPARSPSHLSEEVPSYPGGYGSGSGFTPNVPPNNQANNQAGFLGGFMGDGIPMFTRITMLFGAYQMTATFPSRLTIRDAKRAWLGYHLSVGIDGNPLQMDQFLLQLNGVYQDENTTLGQVSRAQSDNGQSAILDVLIADGPPVYIEDYPTDPGIGVTMKRFHPNQIQITIGSLSGGGFPIHVWPTSTAKEIKACWARAAGVPAQTITVVHNNQLMQDDEDLAFKFSQLMSTMRLQSLYGFPPRGMVLNLEMPKRYMDIYPKPQFLM